MRTLISGTRLFIRGFSFLEKVHRKYIVGVILGSFELFLLFATPYINEQLINIVTGVRKGNIFLPLIGMAAFFLLLVPPIIYGKYMQNSATAEGTAQLQKVMFRHIMEMPCEGLTNYKMGDYVTRLTDDVSRTTGVFSSFAVNNLIRFLVVFSATLVLLLMNDWRIALAGIFYGVINLLFSIYLNPYTKRLEQEAKIATVNSSSFLIEALRGIPIIRVFILQRVLAEKYNKICGIIRAKRIRFRTINGITYGVVDFFAQSAQAVGFILGILLAGDKIALGNAVFNATLMGMMGDAIYRLSTFLLLIQPNLVSMERVFEILDTASESIVCNNEILDVENENAVVFRNVSFSYKGRDLVISHLNFVVKNGENIAVVGGSGGGKSTIIKLMLGFYEPLDGGITYFGKAGKEMTKGDVRRLFSYVPQECTLFDGSIGENIAMGKPGASQMEVENAAQLAGIDSFIESLPEKYATSAGEYGGSLSGGQRQRVAIARAILKGAPILLLDEATAALDSASEMEVQSGLGAIFEGITTITVAHRLSTIRNANRILVLEAGKVVEEGNFAELIEKGGRFRELYDSQMRKRNVSPN